MSHESGVKMLVVDDEVDLNEVIVDTFLQEGYDVSSAFSVTQAKEMLRKNPVEIVLSDVRMPDGTGVDLLRWLRTEVPDGPTMVLMTGFSSVSFEQIYEYGADGIFSKPFNRKDLMATVRRLQLPMPRRLDPASAGAAEKVVVTWDESTSASADGPRIASLGRGGAFVQFSGQFPRVDDWVQFKLALPPSLSFQSSWLEGYGVVRWVRRQNKSEAPSGCGIEFFTLADSCRNEMVEWAKKRRNGAYIPIR